jgi:hypothetical protein
MVAMFSAQPFNVNKYIWLELQAGRAHLYPRPFIFEERSYAYGGCQLLFKMWQGLQG